MALKSLSDLRARTNKLVRKLGWETYHTPENLTLFLLGEAAELAELCQWVTSDKVRKDRDLLKCVQEEIADVMKCVLRLIDAINLPTHLEIIITEKLKMDKKNFPVPLFKGKSKYEVIKTTIKKQSFPDIPRRGRLPRVSTAILQKNAWELVTERDWQQFYTPASLALAISKSCGEVATCYQRRVKSIKRPYQRTVWALADIVINLMRLCQHLNIDDIYPLVLNKLEADEKRFAESRET